MHGRSGNEPNAGNVDTVLNAPVRSIVNATADNVNLMALFNPVSCDLLPTIRMRIDYWRVKVVDDQDFYAIVHLGRSFPFVAHITIESVIVR
jgi:hypothetical protein